MVNPNQVEISKPRVVREQVEIGDILVTDPTITPGVEPRPGFVIWGLICLGISIVGFWPSYVAPIMAGTYADAAPLMPWHVVSAAMWLVLLVSQPALVRLGRVDMHRLFGLLGTLVAVSVVYTGIAVQIDVMAPHAAREDMANAVFVPFFRIVTMVIFAACVALAITLRGRPDWHKRLMILGTFSLLEAPLGRIFSNVLGLPGISGPMAAISHTLLMLLFLMWDRRAHGRFHPATVGGTIIITLVVFGTAPIAFSGWWQQLAARLAGN